MSRSRAIPFALAASLALAACDDPPRQATPEPVLPDPPPPATVLGPLKDLAMACEEYHQIDRLIADLRAKNAGLPSAAPAGTFVLQPLADCSRAPKPRAGDLLKGLKEGWEGAGASTATREEELARRAAQVRQRAVQISRALPKI